MARPESGKAREATAGEIHADASIHRSGNGEDPLGGGIDPRSASKNSEGNREETQGSCPVDAVFGHPYFRCGDVPPGAIEGRKTVPQAGEDQTSRVGPTAETRHQCCPGV